MSRSHYRCTCRRCGVVIQTAGSRLTQETFGVLRDHVRTLYPQDAPGHDADTGQVRKHYTVECEDAP